MSTQATVIVVSTTTAKVWVTDEGPGLITVSSPASASITVSTTGGSGGTGPAGPAGPQGPAGPAGASGLILPGRVISTGSSVTLTTSDGVVLIASPGLNTVTLPTGPTDFQQIFIKDQIGQASISAPISVVAPVGHIDGASSVQLIAPYGSLTLIHAAGIWSIM